MMQIYFNLFAPFSQVMIEKVICIEKNG